MSDKLEKEIMDLKVVHGQTHTLLGALAKQVDDYIKNDELWRKDVEQFKLESSKNLVEVATIVKSLKSDMDKVSKDKVPTLEKKQASTESTLTAHTWFIRSILAVTVIAFLGGTITTIATCDFREAAAQQRNSND